MNSSLFFGKIPSMRCKHVFGPVPSRRLGRSLGLDLTPRKTCSLDCVYCEIGPTTCRTLTRGELVPSNEVIAEARARIAESQPDTVTFSGSGEPTLHSGIGRIIDGLKSFYDGPIAVITNGTLLHMPEIRRDIMRADIVMPSLDAADAETFEAVNRPHPDLTLEAYVEGLARFREEYRGSYRLEVFLVSGMNDSEEQVASIARLADRIGPDIVQLNTTVRASRSGPAPAVPRERLESLLPLFRTRAEVIASWKPAEAGGLPSCRPEEVASLLKRRPCTVADIQAGLGIAEAEALRMLKELRAGGKLEEDILDGETHYSVSG